MKVLYVFSNNAGSVSPFIKEQIDSLAALGVKYKSIAIKGKGIVGYLKNLSKLRRLIADFKPDVIHAHYGLSGLLAVLQRKVPVIITFHGSDVYLVKNRFLSWMASFLAADSIFVSHKMADLMNSRSGIILPCGVNMDIFSPKHKVLVREKLGLDQDAKYILFSSSFTNPVKNAKLALDAVELLNMRGVKCKLLELKGYSREDVARLLNAVDVALMTSFHEGSPQFIKEAMACNCPIVSTNVGDVASVVNGVDGTFISSHNIDDVAKNIENALNYNKRTQGRESIAAYDNINISLKILNIYRKYSETYNNY